MTAPDILIIDDQPHPDAEALAGELERDYASAALAIPPDELTLEHVSRARLVLVDQRLDAWTDERDGDQAALPPDRQLIANRPLNGLALAAVVRSQLRSNDEITGVALLSSNLVDLVQDFSKAATEHAAARLHDLEWAFNKRGMDAFPPLPERVVSLAAAIPSAAARLAAGEDPHDALSRTLALPDAAWAQVADRDIRAAAPPIHQLAASTHGLSIVRWLSQRILPYPTFLIDGPRVALSLGIHPDSFDANKDSIAPVLEECLYAGALATFAGTRWWRAGIRRLARQLTDESRPSPELAAAVANLAGVPLTAMDPPNSVLCVDETLQVCGAPVPREKAARVQADDWPTFAETAWMARDLLEEQPDLWDLVDPSDPGSQAA